MNPTIIAAIISGLIPAITTIGVAIFAVEKIASITINSMNNITPEINVPPQPVTLSVPEPKKPALTASIHVLMGDIAGNIHLIIMGADLASTDTELIRSCGTLKMYVSDAEVRNCCDRISQCIINNDRQHIKQTLRSELPNIEYTFRKYLGQHQWYNPTQI